MMETPKGAFHVRMMFGHKGDIELPHDASHCSIMCTVLPALGAGSTRRAKIRPFITSPPNKRYRVWENFLIILVAYSVWVSPFELGFLSNPSGTLCVADNIVNGFFAINIVWTLFVTFLDRNTYLLVDDPKQIAKYLTSCFVVDVVSTIPSEIPRMMQPKKHQSYLFFNMLWLWRLKRVSALFVRLEKDRHFNNFCVRCVKLLCVTVFSVDCAGCFFFLLAARYPDPSSTWIGASLPDFHSKSLWT